MPIRNRYVQVPFEIAHQTGAIGVVADKMMITFDHQGVDGAGSLGSSRQLVSEIGRSFLMWCRDIQPLAAVRKELQDLAAELRRRDIIESIGQSLVGLARKEAVDEGRPAMADRVADDAVLIQ